MTCPHGITVATAGGCTLCREDFLRVSAECWASGHDSGKTMGKLHNGGAVVQCTRCRQLYSYAPWVDPRAAFR